MSNLKSQIALVLALFVAQVTIANVIEGVAAIPDGYYDGVSGKKTPAAILTALQTCISKNYNEISYKGLEPHYLNTDFYADSLWDMYSTCHFVYEDANKAQKAVCDGWNKEHVCCQSWLGSGPMVSDLFNVYPTDARVNNLRSNYPYGVVGTNKGISNDPDHHALGKLGTSTTSGVGTVYEPDDKYKGDFARTFFYMVARYRDKILNSGDGSTMFSSNPTDLTAYSLSFLLDWHRNDPVSQKEIDRNQAVYGEQNNRNPFIDYPDLVEYIWGTKKNQQVDLESMTPTCDGGGQGPVGNVKYGVSWSVNGTIVSVDSIVENKKIQTLPEMPESCSAGSNVFVGWSSAPIAGITDEAPATLFIASDQFPAVDADIIYYAVFAHAETIDNGKVESTESVNMKAQGFSNGQAVSSIQKGDVTITFGKGTAGSNVPKYYNTGEAVRCYPGNTFTVTATEITKIVLTFGSGDSNNAITVSTGNFTGSTWTGSADEVVFSVGGSSGHRRLAQLDVTMNGSGAQTIYSAFLTSCNGTEDLPSLQGETESRPVKVLIDGHLYIKFDGRLYDILGRPARN